LIIFLGNARITFFELNSIFGHDTFLLDVNGVSTALKVCERMNLLFCIVIYFLALIGFSGNIGSVN
jgi:hypothetical protein